MKKLTVAAAVAASLAASSAAFALDPATTAAVVNGTLPGVVLTVAGASAARNSFGLELSTLKEDGTQNPTSLCQSSTDPAVRFDVLRSSSPDFRAYSCTLITTIATSGPNTNLNGQRAVVFYRSEGGSAWGPLSLIAGQMCAGGSTTQCAGGGVNTIKRLDVTSCATTASNVTGVLSSGTTLATSTYNCSIVGYSFDSDAATSGVQEATTEFAVSDVEPAMFGFANNYPQSGKFKTFQSATLKPALNTLNGLAQRGFGEIFGVIVNDSVATRNLNRQDLAAIFSRSISNWGSVPNYTAGSGFNTAAPITICRREPGSGTQVVAQAQYLGQNCGSSAALTFATATSGAGIVENTTSSALNNCVVNNPGAIGISVLGTAPTGSHFVTIDTIEPTRVNAASGQYPYTSELTYTQRQGLTASNPNGARLATLLQQRGQQAASMPNNVSTYAIPGIGGNVPAFAISTTTPIGLGTKNKNTCAPATLVN